MNTRKVVAATAGSPRTNVGSMPHEYRRVLGYA